MAKKRVHELAKQYDMPTQEVLRRLQAYGLEVKAAATAVDEKLADAALTGKPKPKAAAANGAAKKAAPPVAQQRAGFGHGTARAPRAENLAPKAPPKEVKPEAPAPPVANGGAAGAQRQRPTRSSLQGERAPGAAGGVRRVVIDSQAARPRVPAARAAAPAAVPRSARRGAAAAGAGAAPTRSRSRRTSRRSSPTSSGSTPARRSRTSPSTSASACPR